jgi:class 3 adenylate cyclase
MRSDLPAGIVTFLFTDVEGSTKRMAETGEGRALALQDAVGEALASID